jgi:hypothetical protein
MRVVTPGDRLERILNRQPTLDRNDVRCRVVHGANDGQLAVAGRFVGTVRLGS